MRYSHRGNYKLGVAPTTVLCVVTRKGHGQISKALRRSVRGGQGAEEIGRRLQHCLAAASREGTGPNRKAESASKRRYDQRSIHSKHDTHRGSGRGGHHVEVG